MLSTRMHSDESQHPLKLRSMRTGFSILLSAKNDFRAWLAPGSNLIAGIASTPFYLTLCSAKDNCYTV